MLVYATIIYGYRKIDFILFLMWLEKLTKLPAIHFFVRPHLVILSFHRVCRRIKKFWHVIHLYIYCKQWNLFPLCKIFPFLYTWFTNSIIFNNHVQNKNNRMSQGRNRCHKIRNINSSVVECILILFPLGKSILQRTTFFC